MITRPNQKESWPALAKGQLWKLKHVYIQIVGLGGRLLSYKMLDSLDEDGVRPKMSDIEVMWRYLRTRNARLVEDRAAS